MRRVFNRIIADVVTADRHDRTHAHVAVVEMLRAGNSLGSSYLGGSILGFFREPSPRGQQWQPALSGCRPALALCCLAVDRSPQQKRIAAGWGLRFLGRA